MGFADRLLRIGPHGGAHRVALRAAVSVVVPLLALLAVDRLEWSIYATFGAFTSLYGRERTGRHRLRLQVEAGVVQVAVVTLGAVVALSAERAWLSVPVAAAVAMSASFLSARRGWHPPGSLFQVFGFAAVASAPATGDDLAPAVLVAAGSAAFSVLVGSLGALARRREAPAPPAARRRPRIPGLRRAVLQSGLGVAAAGVIATSAGIGRPYWAMVSAVVPLVATDLGGQLVRGLHRVVGTGLGLLFAWALFALDLPGLGLVLVAAVLQAGAELLVGRNYALALVFVTPLALLMVHLVVPGPVGALLADRGLETVIGVLVGLAVGYLTRPRRPPVSTLAGVTQRP